MSLMPWWKEQKRDTFFIGHDLRDLGQIVPSTKAPDVVVVSLKLSNVDTFFPSQYANYTNAIP